MKKKKIIILSIMIIVVALLLEASILKYVNDRNAQRTSKVLLDRVITVPDKNDESRNELIESLKDDYIVRAKAVSYMIDAYPAVEYDVDELQKIAKLMAVDEIFLMIREPFTVVLHPSILAIILIPVRRWSILSPCLRINR